MNFAADGSVQCGTHDALILLRSLSSYPYVSAVPPTSILFAFIYTSCSTGRPPLLHLLTMAPLTLALPFLFLPALVLSADPIHVPLTRRGTHKKLDLNKEALRLRTKYGFGEAAAKASRRATVGRRGTAAGIPVTNQVFSFLLEKSSCWLTDCRLQDDDSSYFGTVTIGTP